MDSADLGWDHIGDFCEYGNELWGFLTNRVTISFWRNILHCGVSCCMSLYCIC